MSDLHAHGLSLAVPRGWDAHVFRRRDSAAGERAHPVLHAASFPLPPGCGDFGSGAVDVMTRDDVLVVLVEYDAASAGTALFAHRGLPRPRPDHFHPRQLQRTLPGQSGAQFFFHAGPRAFCLYVVLGSHARRAALVPKAQAALDHLSIH